MILKMEKVAFINMEEKDMKGIGKMTSLMEKEYNILLMEIVIKDFLLMEWKKGLESITFLMEMFRKESGKMICLVVGIIED